MMKRFRVVSFKIRLLRLFMGRISIKYQICKTCKNQKWDLRDILYKWVSQYNQCGAKSLSSPEITDVLLEVAGSDGIFTETALALRTFLKRWRLEQNRSSREINQESFTLMVLLALHVPHRWCPARQLKTGWSFLNFSKQTLKLNK